MTEPPRRRRCGTACLIVMNVPTRLMSRVERKSSTVRSSIPAQVPLTPALATSTSSRPHLSTVVAMADRTESSSLTSQVTASAVPPSRPIASATSTSSSEVLPASATRTPAPCQQRRRGLSDARPATTDERHLVLHGHQPRIAVLGMNAPRPREPEFFTRSDIVAGRAGQQLPLSTSRCVVPVPRPNLFTGARAASVRNPRPAGWVDPDTSPTRLRSRWVTVAEPEVPRALPVMVTSSWTERPPGRARRSRVRQGRTATWTCTPKLL